MKDNKLFYFIFGLIFLFYFLKIILYNTLIFNFLQSFSILLLSAYCLRFLKFKINLPFLFIILYFFFMIYRGILFDNYLLYFLSDTSKFSTLALLLFFGSNVKLNNLKLEKIIKLICNYFYFALPVSIILTIILGLNLADSIDTRFNVSSTYVQEKAPIMLLYISIFISPFYKYLNKSHKTITLLSLIFLMFLGIMTASRTISILPLFSIILIFIKNFKHLFLKYFLGSLFIFFLLLSTNKLENINKSISVLHYRFFGLADSSTGRDDEQSIYLKSITTDELWFGKGIGGSNNTWIWQNTENGMSMMHRGYMYHILKGGLIWCIIWYSMFVISIFRLIRTKFEYKIPILISISLIIISEISVTTWLNPTIFIFQILLISFSLKSKVLRRI